MWILSWGIIHHVVVCLNTDAERQRQEKLVLFFETENLILRFKTLFSQSTIILVDGFGTALLHFHLHLEIWIPILPLKIFLLGLTVSACNFVYCAVPIFLKFSNCVLIIVQYTSCLLLCSSEFEFRTSLFFPPFVCFLNNKKFSWIKTRIYFSHVTNIKAGSIKYFLSKCYRR